MKTDRFFFHDFFTHPKSRMIFALFLIVAISMGVWIFYFVDGNLASVRINRRVLNSFDYDLGAYVLSWPFRLFVVLLAAIIAAALTSFKVMGAGHRILRWLERWLEGKSLEELKIRSTDKFWYLTKLINEWYRQSKK